MPAHSLRLKKPSRTWIWKLLHRQSTQPPPPKPKISGLIKLQKANGSINDDLAESVLTLLVFILEGNTRHSGLRKRNVIKLVVWLDSQPDSELKTHAMTILKEAESGQKIEENRAWKAIAPKSFAHRFLTPH